MKYSIIRVVFEFPPIVGGSVTHIVELARKINPFLQKQIIIAPDFGDECKELDEKIDLTVIRLPYREYLAIGSLLASPPVLFFYANDCVNTIQGLLNQGNRIDIIHVHGALLGVLLSLFMKLKNINIPVVIMQHGVYLHRSIGEIIYNALPLFLMNFAEPNHIILLDDGTDINEYLSKLKRKRIDCTIVYHGIDVESISSIVSKHVANDNCNNFRIISTSRLVPVKRIDLAILAFNKFINAFGENKKDINLILVGSGGKYEKELKGLVNEVGLSSFVNFLGGKEYNEVITTVNISDIAIGTSLESNMNRAIQEAMACQKPVVVFDSGGTNRLIKNMENGVLVKPGDIDDFANKLKLLYESPELRHRIGKNARDTIIKERSWDSRIKKELKIYSEEKNQ